MSTAIARNLMAEMKLLGMFDAFDRLVTEATRHQWSCTDFLDAILQAENDFRTSARPNGVSRPPSSHCVPPSRTSTLLPTARLPGPRSRTSIVCIGCQTHGLFC